METKHISYRGTDVFYKVAGNGLPVVLIHGFAEDGNVWHYQIDYLKQYFRVLVSDIPGSGLSPFNKNLSSVEDYAEAIKSILDNEKIETCILTGHSLGGYIALAFAERYPQLLKAFGLFHSTAFADSEEKKQTRLKSIEFIKTNGAYLFIKTSAPNLFTNDYKINHPKKLESLIEKGKNFTSEALIQYYHAMIARPDRTAVLKSFIKPVLFIIGEQDNAVPLQSSLQQYHLPSQSHIYILKNSAHMGMWEETEKSNEILLNFLNLFCSL